MSPSFDLTERGFCAVRWLPGREPAEPSKLLGLRDLLVHARDIADVQVSDPPALSGFLRVLYVLAARVTGLDRIGDPDDWNQRRGELLDGPGFDPDEVHRYFDRHPGRFELFHTATDLPFLQDKRLLEQCRTSKGAPTSSGVNKLVPGRASGQSFVWLSHTNDLEMQSVPVQDAVFALLSWLYYGAPGRCTPRQVNGTTEANTKAGPLRGTVSYHPLGETFFETLILGIPFVEPSDTDVAAWETSREPDPLGLPPRPSGIGGLLTGRFQHAVLLGPSPDGSDVDDAWITWAWRLPQGQPRDPFLIHRVSKNGETFPATAESDRLVWRDLDALIGERDGAFRPEVFAALDDLMDQRRRPVRVKALGFDQDRAQVKDRQFVSGTTPALRQQWKAAHSDAPEPWHRLRTALRCAEITGWQLSSALTALWHSLAKTKPDKRLRDSGSPVLHLGMSRYWASAENCFWEIVLADEPTDNSVANQFILCALDAYDTATRHFHGIGRADDSPIKKIELQRRRLWRGWEGPSQGDDDE